MCLIVFLFEVIVGTQLLGGNSLLATLILNHLVTPFNIKGYLDRWLRIKVKLWKQPHQLIVLRDDLIWTFLPLFISLQKHIRFPTKDMISLQKQKTLVLPLSSILHLSHQHFEYIPMHHLCNPPIKLSEEKQKIVEKQRRVRSPTKDMISLQKQNILVLPLSSVLHLSAYFSQTLWVCPYTPLLQSTIKIEVIEAEHIKEKHMTRSNEGM